MTPAHKVVYCLPPWTRCFDLKRTLSGISSPLVYLTKGSLLLFQIAVVLPTGLQCLASQPCFRDAGRRVRFRTEGRSHLPHCKGFPSCVTGKAGSDTFQRLSAGSTKTELFLEKWKMLGACWYNTPYVADWECSQRRKQRRDPFDTHRQILSSIEGLFWLNR